MGPAAHLLSASLIAVAAARVRPEQAPYVAAALVAAVIVDADHLAFVVRSRESFDRRIGYTGQLHNGRSPLHELPGLFLLGFLCALVFPLDATLAAVIFIAFAIHLAQDWVLGETHPFAPFDHTLVRFFTLNLSQKVAIDLLVMAVSGAAWIAYLSGPA
jgi:hypothetical protein